MRLVEFSDLSVDGMVYECWEDASDGDATLLFSLVEDEGRVALRAIEPMVDLALVTTVVAMVNFSPGFRSSLDAQE